LLPSGYSPQIARASPADCQQLFARSPGRPPFCIFVAGLLRADFLADLRSIRSRFAALSNTPLFFEPVETVYS